MDLRNLNTFIQVAESGSFTRAGQVLGYSQPTISIQIRQLEEELEVKLFDRIGHTVRLTDKGRDLLTYAQQICHMCQTMAQHTHREGQPHGTIRLATADSLCGPLFDWEFANFRALHPGITLRVTTAGTDELFRLLDHNEVDLVCTLDTHIYDTNYITAAEAQVGVHFVAASSHPLAAKDTVTIEELLREPFLLTEKGMSYRRLMDEILARESVEIRPVFEIGRADIICRMVERGVGLSFLPDYVTQAGVEQGTVTRLRVPRVEPPLWKQLLYHRDKWVSPQMQAVIDHFSGI